jgi:hypothetical protein
MDALTSSLIIGFVIGASCVWLVSFINGRFLQREKHLSALLLKRAKKA